MQPPVSLSAGRPRIPENDALVSHTGGRVGLTGVLDTPERRADTLDTRRSGAAYAFAWDREDQRSRRWWPQGITTSADADPSERYAGRRVVVTTSYSKVVRGLGMGSRLSVVDVTDPGRVRYDHVLLVVAELGEDGALTVRPLRVHAGGVVWHGPYLHVAATARGFFTFHVDDVVATSVTGRPGAIGPTGGGGLAAYGHRYLLPVRFVHAARTVEGAQPFRYSFLSLSHGEGQDRLVAGEYGRGRMTTRLLAYDLDPTTGLPATDAHRTARPVRLERGVPRMQGAVDVEGRYYVTTSAGRRGRGSIWSGAAGELLERRKVLPAGPEDLTYWPSTDRLWTVTEYPRRRVVVALDRSRFE
jgi:YD repeat-containing protein